jgi:hypothetical protein
MSVATLNGIDSMEAFLRPRNTLLQEQSNQVRKSVSRWRLLKRRRMLRAAVREVDSALTSAELRVQKQYDRDATGWSLVLVGAVVLCVVSWTQVHL